MTALHGQKLGLVVPPALHEKMLRRAQVGGQGRGRVQRTYQAAFEALLAAIQMGEAVAFAAVRGPKIRVTLRLPARLCMRIRACLARLTLKLTDFACAAVARFLSDCEGA